jgi:hypothetical protein
VLRAAKDLGYDTQQAWLRAQQLTAAIATAAPRLRSRPRPFPVTGTDTSGDRWDGTWLVFSTCCYLYKARPGHGYCTVCPLNDDSNRDWHWMRNYPPAPQIAAAPAARTSCPER